MSSIDASSILIVGAGIFGTSTAYHLSQCLAHPSSVTVIDRTSTPPNHAASTDINKIIRTDYTSPFYMSLAYEAMDEWAHAPWLKRPNGERFFHRTGWVMLDEEGSDLAERIRRNFRERGKDPTSDIPLENVRQEWDGVLKETDTRGFKSAYWNPEAGWAEAEAAVQAMMEEALKRGVKYMCGDVDKLIMKHDRKEVRGVRTRDGRILEADKVVLATGAWTSQIMTTTEDELNIKEQDRVERQVTAAGVCVAHFKMSEQEENRLKEMPVVVYGSKGEAIPVPKRNHLLKFTNANTFTNTVSTQSGHKISVPPDRDQTVVSEKLKRETMETMIKRVMPQYANRPAEYWRLCWDSITPSQDQLITKHPHAQLANLYLAVGGSFHSWKFLPIIGKYVLKVMQGQSNGEEKDKAWSWKTGNERGRGAHEKVIPKRELRDVEDEGEARFAARL